MRFLSVCATNMGARKAKKRLESLGLWALWQTQEFRTILIRDLSAHTNRDQITIAAFAKSGRRFST
jgi:hypothetical protein